MFDQFFTGTIDQLLEHIQNAPKNEIDEIENPNRILNHAEIVAHIQEEYNISKDEAEKIATEIQLEEFHKICKRLVDEGLLEIVDYDDDGPVYKPV